MTHNEYQEFLKQNASRFNNEKGYSMEDYERDADSVDITGFELEQFNLSDEAKVIINKMFHSDEKSRLENMLLRGHVFSSDQHAIGNSLGCELMKDNYYNGFFKNDESRCFFEFCEGDISLVLCETDLEYKKELERYCEFYEIETPPFEVKVFDEETFDYDKARVGDLVEQRVVDHAMNALPPVSMSSECAQPGGAWSMREDPETGKLRDTYVTFKRITSGENGLWKFCGDCFAGEHVIRGKEPEWMRKWTEEKEVKSDLNAKISSAQERVGSQEVSRKEQQAAKETVRG